jgi:hypothetical protein
LIPVLAQVCYVRRPVEIFTLLTISMKIIHNTVLSAIAATSAMTWFSYFISKKKNENFKEPKLLGDLVQRSLGTKSSGSQSLGWALHYLIGTGFTAIYKILLRYRSKKPSLKNGFQYGALAGGIGVLAWKVLFKNHNNPPKTNRKEFYTQLIFAHLIFGLTLSAFKNKRKP